MRKCLYTPLLGTLLFSVVAGSAYAAIAIDATVSADKSTAATTVATPQFSTTSGNELLLAFIATDATGSASMTVQSVSGAGLTWSLVVRTNAQKGTSEIWRAFAPAALNNSAVTATLSQSVQSSITVRTFTGVDPTGTKLTGATKSASAATGTPTATLVTTAANSWVFGVGNDWDSATLRTVGTGQSLVHQFASPAGDLYWVQMQNQPTPATGTSVTINDTAPTKDRYNLSICEILAAPAGGGSTFTISGTITPTAAGSLATVTLSGAATATVTADSSGNYSFPNLPNGTYTVTPSKTGFTFNPSSQPVTINNANQTGINFTGQSTATWMISGTITPTAAGGLASVTLSGAATATVTADSSGNYSFPNLANGTYTVSPSKTGFTFTPSSQPVTINGANQTGINFTGQSTATWMISGTITPTAAGGLATVTLSGAGTATVTADSSGNYSFPNLPNGTYTVTPSKTGFTFNPSSQPVAINGANQTGINFAGQSTATFSISGTISPTSIGNGATVALSGTATGTTTADSSGNYVFTGLSNGNYTVTPSKSGITFTPANQPVTVNGANVVAVNFTGQTGQTSSIQLRQKNVSGTESTVRQISVAFSSDNTAGNLLVVTGTSARPAGTIVVSDTAGNAYIPAIGPVQDPNQSVNAYIWYVPNCKSGPNTVTIVGSAPSSMEIHVSEYTGLDQTSPLDQVSSAAGDGTAVSSGPKTTTVNGELIFGYTFIYNVASPGTGYTALTLVNGDLDEYQVQGTAGSIDASFTQAAGPPAFWFALMATFKPAPAIGIWSISGNISPTAGGSNATVTLSGPVNASVISDASGNYSFANLPNGTYTVTPSNNGFVFAPTTATVTINGANPPPVNFTAQPGTPTWSITGTISPAAGGSGATVTVSGAASFSVIADANGNYTASQLANGTYTITPSKVPYTFNPPNQTTSVNGTNVTGVNFTASAPSNSITLDVNSSKDGQSASTTIASQLFSTSAGNELLLAFIATDHVSGPANTVTGVTGGGLTWTLVVRANAQAGTSEIWRAFAPTPLSLATVTATLSQNVAATITVMSFTGTNGSAASPAAAIGAIANQSSPSGAPTTTLITTANNSWVLGVGNDYDKAISRTVGSGQSMVHQYLAASGDTYWVQMRTNPVASSGTSVTINDTAPATDRYNLAAVEIVSGTANVSDTTPPTVSMTSPAPGMTIASLETVTASASDNTFVAGVQFFLDGSPLGAELTAQPYSMTWDTTTAATGSHTLTARARDSVGLTTVSTPVTITVDNSGNPAVVGSWSSVVSLPAVAVNMLLLKNNQIMFYQSGGTPTVWNYTNNTFLNVPAQPDLFCSGHALLSDGRVLVVGGFGGGGNFGITNAEIFDPATNNWTPVPDMAFRRWYPTATTLSDGRIMVTAGWQSSAHTNAGISEIYDPATNNWTQLTNANNPFETYPFMYLLPDGRVIHIGGSEYPTDTDVLDLSTISWSVIDPNIVDGGSATMYTVGKFMKAGSAADSQNVGPSSNTTFVLDMTQPSPAWRQTPSMAYPRSFLNLTTLPDGTVLATGGEKDKNGGDISQAVYAAELWSPLTQAWSTMSSMKTPREYHGTALLLPDGRVLVSGMGADFGQVPDQLSAEFYSPPYLFKGARPSISSSPTAVQTGTNFFVGTPDAASIASVALVRTGAVTHFFDQNERHIELNFTQAAGGLTVTAPATANIAPPGYYMLFIVNDVGVPSIAPFVQVH